MKKLALASFCVLAMVGFAMADQFNATINKIDGKTVSFTKKGMKGAPGDTGKADLADKVKVANGKAGGKGMPPEVLDDVPDGLKNAIFTKIDEKGINANITTDEKSGKITQILVLPAKGTGKGTGKGIGKKSAGTGK